MQVKIGEKTIGVEASQLMITAVKNGFGSLYKNVLALKSGSKLHELCEVVQENAEYQEVTFDSNEGRQIYWHSSSHILAAAVKRLFPDAKVAIGPAINEGFYYDFGVEKAFSEEDLTNIEKEAKKIISANEKFEKIVISRKEAVEMFAKQGEIYKVEILENDIEDDTVTLYKTGDFVDLCRGPHIFSSGFVRELKILSSSGAYWRGSENNDMLQRIYAISFPEKDMMKEFIHLREEAKKRNHKKLGMQMELFSFHPEAPGEVFWHNNGVLLRNALVDFMRNIHNSKGYQEIMTPLVLKRNLWEQSGHWENYRNNMFTTEIEDEDYAIKPMNCPGGMLMFKERRVSYRELPMKVAEFGLVHRYERSGALNGLFRVRAFTQDDAHIFMTDDQLTGQIEDVLEIIDYIYKVFGFEYKIELSTRPEKYIGELEQWERSESSLKKALDNSRRNYVINEGDGAFYGPKIDFHLTDSMKRTHQCATIQVDMNLPERFDISYEGSDGSKHRPVIIHRAILGSIERFIGILIEHYAGSFPVWLSPVQVVVIPVSEKFNDSIGEITSKLKASGIRVESDLRNERVGYKIREAELKKVPYMCIIGEKEVESQTINVRKHKSGLIEGEMKLEEFINKIQEEISNKT